MRRTPIVVTATVAGLAGVLAFHTTPASVGALSGVSGSIGAGSSPTGPSPTGTAASGSGSRPRSGSKKHAPTGSRTITGPAINYSYGELSVSVTVSGHKITKVGIGSINDGGIPRSQYIDQQAIPILEQETLQAQSASIQGVSGASYTSAGFQQSLQAALQSAGIQ